MKQPLGLSKKPFSSISSFFIFILCLNFLTSCGQRNQRRPLIDLGDTKKPSIEDGVLEVRDELYSWLEEAASGPLSYPEEREQLTYDIVYKYPKQISFRVTGSNLFCKGYFKRASITKRFLEGDNEKGIYSFSVVKKLKDFELDIGYGKEAREDCEDFYKKSELPPIKETVNPEKRREEFLSLFKEKIDSSLRACRSNELFKGQRCVDLEMEFSKSFYRQLSWKEDAANLNMVFSLQSVDGMTSQKEVKIYFSPFRYYLPGGNVLAKKGDFPQVQRNQSVDFIFEIRNLKLLFSSN
ncbi:MAG: hypothetical protein VXW15_03905 [Bdellovibrionota bacterium]|nr:hypothetical protein [Bdellovibrionota bacterium]